MEFICKYCGKVCKNANSLRNHERMCPQNENRQYPSQNGIIALKKLTKSRGAWNKGLTKDTDERVRKGGITLSNKYKTGLLTPSFTGKHHTEETKTRLRKSGGLRINSGRGHCGWYKGYYCSSTYELVYVIYNLDHDIKFERCRLYYWYEYNGEKHRYYPDFILSDGSLVEIKGYHSEIVDIKAASVTDRPITLIYKKDMLEMFNYVKTTYSVSKLEDLYDKTF